MRFQSFGWRLCRLAYEARPSDIEAHVGEGLGNAVISRTGAAGRRRFNEPFPVALPSVQIKRRNRPRVPYSGIEISVPPGHFVPERK